MIHELKLEKKHYNAVLDGYRCFYIAENDLGIQLGDTVILKEWDEARLRETDKRPIGFTGSKDLQYTVGNVYILNSSEVIFSLLIPTTDNRTRKPKS